MTDGAELFPGDDPLTDAEIRNLGYAPTARGWRRLATSERDASRTPRQDVPADAPEDLDEWEPEAAEVAPDGHQEAQERVSRPDEGSGRGKRATRPTRPRRDSAGGRTA